MNLQNIKLKSHIKNIFCSESLRAKVSILVITSIVLLIRRTDSFVNPQFWAEDAAVFFLQQYENGLSAITQPYAGYLHLIPRLIAFFSETFFSYSAAPSVYNFSSFAITLFVVSSIYSQRLDVNCKGLFALSLVLIPHHQNEVFMNATNIQWILCILLVIIAMKEDPNPKYGNIKTQYVYDAVTVIFCGLTGPFLALISPLFAWKWFQNKSKYNSIIMLIASLIAIIQLSVMFSTSAVSNSNSINLDLSIYSQLIGMKILGGLFLGDLAQHISPYLLSAMYFSLILTLLWYPSHKKEFIGFFLYTHLIILLATFHKFNATPQILIPVANGSRYFYVPYVMIAWSLIIALEKTKNWKKTLIVIALLCILYSSLSSSFRSHFIDYNWQFYSNSIGKEDVFIPINPEGWEIKVKARK